MNNRNGHQIIVEARLTTTLRRHAFGEGDHSLCGLAYIEACDQIRMCKVSKRLQLYLWPAEDLNYCGKCRVSLNARGLIV